MSGRGVSGGLGLKAAAVLILMGTVILLSSRPVLAATPEPGAPFKMVMLGDSLTQGGKWRGYFPEYKVLNQGVGGDTTMMILKRISQVISAKPDVVFIQGGINDFASKKSGEAIIGNHAEIWAGLKRQLPESKICVISLLPVSNAKFTGWNERIRELNRELKAEAESAGLIFVDLYPALSDETGQLRADLTYDGLHLTAAGYQIWAGVLRPLIENLAKKANQEQILRE